MIFFPFLSFFDETKKMQEGVFFIGTCVVVLFLIQLSAAVSHHKPTDIIYSNCIRHPEGITREARERHEASWRASRFKREELIDWFRIFFPGNTIGLNISECNKIRNRFLKGPEKGVVESCEKIFWKCDCNNDGIIDDEDFENAKDYCLKDANAAEKLNYYVADRLVDKNDPYGAMKEPEPVDPALIAED
jgi:hypothetical protein